MTIARGSVLPRRVGKSAPFQSLRASENLARFAHASAMMTAGRVGKIAPERGGCSRLATRDFAHPTGPRPRNDNGEINR